MIISAGNNETFPFAYPVGVGLVESAMNLTRALLFDKPSFLLFVGSAGSYGDYKPFDIVESSSASQIEDSFFQKKSYTPLENALKSETDFVKDSTMINSSNYITTCKEASKNMLSLKIGLENMEFFSVLSVAKHFEVPVGGVFVVTNFTDDNAHQDFITNHDRAMITLIKYLKDKGIVTLR